MTSFTFGLALIGAAILFFILLQRRKTLLLRRILAVYGFSSIHQRDGKGNTPLLHAFWMDMDVMVGLLMEADADLHAVNFAGQNALHITAQTNNIGAIEFLTAQGVNKTARDNEGRTPLQLALKAKHASVAKILKDRGGDARIKPLSQKKLGQELLALLGFRNINDIDPKTGDTPLHQVTLMDKTFPPQCLPQDFDMTDYTPLDFFKTRFAADSTAIAAHLIKNGAAVDKPNKKSWTPLMIALVEKKEELALLLLSHGANARAVETENSTPLHFAAWHQMNKAAEALLEKGSDPSAENKNGLTPLMIALAKKNETLALLLLEKGADALTCDKDGTTALHFASESGLNKAAKALLAKGANPTATKKGGWTPLTIAENEGHQKIAALLKG